MICRGSPGTLAPHVPDLTDADYDALFAVLQPDLPRIWREIFPQLLAQLREPEY